MSEIAEDGIARDRPGRCRARKAAWWLAALAYVLVPCATDIWYLNAEYEANLSRYLPESCKPWLAELHLCGNDSRGWGGGTRSISSSNISLAYPSTNWSDHGWSYLNKEGRSLRQSRHETCIKLTRGEQKNLREVRFETVATSRYWANRREGIWTINASGRKVAELEYRDGTLLNKKILADENNGGISQEPDVIFIINNVLHN